MDANLLNVGDKVELLVILRSIDKNEWILATVTAKSDKGAVTLVGTSSKGITHTARLITAEGRKSSRLAPVGTHTSIFPVYPADMQLLM